MKAEKKPKIFLSSQARKFTIWFVLPPGYPFFAYALSLSLWCYATPFLFFFLFTLDATTYLLFQRLREWGNKRWHFIADLRTERKPMLLILLHQLGSISRDLIHRRDNFPFGLLLSNFWTLPKLPGKQFNLTSNTCCTYHISLRQLKPIFYRFSLELLASQV